MNLKTSYSLVALLGLTLILNACAFKKDDGKEESATPAKDVVETIKQERLKEVANGQLTKKNVKVTFHERSNEYGTYDMVLTWPLNIEQVDIIINNRYVDRGVRNGKYTIPVISGELLVIELNAYGTISAGVISSVKIEDSAPRDEIIRDVTYLSEDSVMIADRVIFYPKSRIETAGFNFKIKTKKLIVLNEKDIPQPMLPSEAHILTTLSGVTAKSNQQIANSNIVINADTAIGDLRVALIGFDGQNGSDGAAPETNDLTGKKGADAVVTTDSVPCTSRKLDIPCERKQTICKTPPENGGSGKDGINGSDGSNGQNGGNTGTLVLDIKDSSKLTVSVAQKTGRPGKGGLASKGTQGGQGGEAGNNKVLCPPAKSGANGNNGTDGSPGADGKDGVKSEVNKTVNKLHVYDI